MRRFFEWLDQSGDLFVVACLVLLVALIVTERRLSKGK